MVFQEESKTSWLWPLSNRATSKEVKDLNSSRSDDEDSWDDGRAFEIADVLEAGLAREIVSDFMHPLRRSSRLWRFHVVRSEDRQQFRLYSDDGDFLMFAQACQNERLVNFFAYNPSDQDLGLFDPARPAFTMSWNKAKTDWRLVQERCENCQFAPKHMSCACSGKQQVAFMRHHRRPIGEGVFNCMEVHVPGLYSDESRVLWCPKLGRSDLSEPPDGSNQSLQLETKSPVWNDEVESLVLDFKGRNVLSSAKNFQLSPEHKKDHVICQFGKIGANTFSLDFRYPLSVIQAFGTALTTMHWA